MKTLFVILMLLSCFTARAGWRATNLAAAVWVQIQHSSTAEGPILTNAFTMSAWFEREIDRAPFRSTLITKGNTHPLAGGIICYELSIRTNRIQFRYMQPGGATTHVWVASSTAPNTNEVAHVAFKYTFGTVGSAALFVNGVSSSGSWHEGTGFEPTTNVSKSLMFSQDAGSLTQFQGLITEIAIWSSMLSNHEILTLYTSRLKRYPLMISPGTLVGYWPLDGWPEAKSPSSDIIPLIINMKEGVGLYGNTGNLGSFYHVNERWLSYPPNE